MENQSKHKIIYTTGNGRVIYCQCCDTACIEYKNIMWKFKRAPLHEFQKLVSSFNKNYMQAAEKRIFLRLPNSDVSLSFSYDELDELKELIAESLLFLDKQYLEKIYGSRE